MHQFIFTNIDWFNCFIPGWLVCLTFTSCGSYWRWILTLIQMLGSKLVVDIRTTWSCRSSGVSTPWTPATVALWTIQCAALAMVNSIYRGSWHGQTVATWASTQFLTWWRWVLGKQQCCAPRNGRRRESRRRIGLAGAHKLSTPRGHASEGPASWMP